MLGQVLKPRLTLGRVLDALRDPHYRTGYALVANTIGTTVVGFFYWVVAAHLYDRQALGRCSALVSALIVVSALAQLDLPTILPRFLPQAGRSAGRFIAYGYGASSVAALIAGVGFVTILPRLSSQWQFLRASPLLAAMFVAALLIWGIFALEDAALTGLHRAVVVPVENSAYGVIKLVLLVAVASVLPSFGVFVAWLIPLLAIVPAVNWLIFRRYAKARDTAAAAALHAREVIRFALIDYAGSLFAQGYGYALPLLVLSVLGATANGTFFVAYTLASALALTAFNFGTSLLVEGLRAPDRLPQLTRGVLLRCAADHDIRRGRAGRRRTLHSAHLRLRVRRQRVRATRCPRGGHHPVQHRHHHNRAGPDSGSGWPGGDHAAGPGRARARPERAVDEEIGY